MNQPYHMVATSIIASVLLTLGLAFYKFIFPKKNIHPLILLILISILPIISIFRAGTYQSGDLTTHAFRTLSMYSAFRDGVIIPRWSEMLNATYGYPLFIFTYPLPYYLAALIHFLNFPVIDSLKVLLAFSFVLSGIAMYFWIKELFGKIAGFVSGVFYLFAPYHLVNMHFRVDVGETLAFVFMPLTLLFARKIIREEKLKWIVLEMISISGLIMSHQAISMAFVSIVIIYGLFEFYNIKKREIQKILRFFLSFFLGFSLSAFYWLPAVVEGIYTKRAAYSMLIAYVKPLQLVFSPWRLGFLFQGPKGELSFIIGYIQWLVVLSAIFFLLKNKLRNLYEKRLLFVLLSLFIFLVFMMLQTSSFIWDSIPLIKNFQFTYRLLAIEALLTSAIAGIFVKIVKSRIVIYIICFIAIFSTILNWGNRAMVPQLSDETLIKNSPMSTISIEGLWPAAPRWVDTDHPWMNSVPKSHIEVLSGDVVIQQTFRNSVLHKYSINTKNTSLLKENTLYFPGWNLYANEKMITMDYQNPKYPGIITFGLSPGNYNVALTFENTRIVTISEWISILTIIGVAALFLINQLRPKLKIKIS